jgi:hypothetical protein
MSVIYRCVKDNNNSNVIAIGYNENQANKNYNGIGIWQDFTFNEIPTVPQDVLNWVQSSGYMGTLLKVVDSTVVPKTLEELQA